MIYAVTGVGPRTGTSWTMKQLEKAGLPVYRTEYLHIDGAEYETDPNELHGLKSVIVKVWPAYLSKATIGRMVVLSRDFNEQISSMKRQMDCERKQGFAFSQKPSDMIATSKWILDQSKVQKLKVRTEDLNDRIGEIVDWMSEPYEQVRRA